jgi:hypothetical protein
MCRILARTLAAMRTCAHSCRSRPAVLARVAASEAVPPLELGRGRTKRRTALSIVATSEPRDQRQHQNTSGGGTDGVGDEYAISAAANPEADQSAHR